MIEDRHSEGGNERGLTVEYALTRREIFRSVLQSVAKSPKFRGTILVYSASLGVFSLMLDGVLSRSLTLRGAISALVWAVGTFLFIPLWTSIRGKTGKRTLTISSDGISTEIGKLKGQVPWDKVGVVTETRQFVLIARTNGNAFFIPTRAFAGLEHRDHFVTEIKHWVKAGTQ